MLTACRISLLIASGFFFSEIRKQCHQLRENGGGGWTFKEREDMR